MEATERQPDRHSYSSQYINISNSLHTEAERRINAGICTVPTINGSKAPSYILTNGEEKLIEWKCFLDRLPTACELGNYFQPAGVDCGRTGIGILAGRYSIVERNGESLAPVVIDIDDKLVWFDFERLCRKDIRASTILDRCLLENTRRAVHIAALVPALYATRRLAGEQLPGETKIRALIELKTNFVKTAPSPGYTLVHGDWADLPVLSVEDFDYLIALAQRLDKVGKAGAVQTPLHTSIPSKAKPSRCQRTPMLQGNRHLLPSNIGNADTEVLDAAALRQMTNDPANLETMAAFLQLPSPGPGKKFSCVFDGPDNDYSMNWLAPRTGKESWHIVCHHPGDHGEHRSVTLAEYYFYRVNGQLPSWGKAHKPTQSFWWQKLLVDSGCMAVPAIHFPKLPTTAPDYVQDVWQWICHAYAVRALRRGIQHALPLVWRFLEEISGGMVEQHYIRKALRWLVGRGILATMGKHGKLHLYSLFGNRKLRKAMQHTDMDMSRRDLQDVEPMNAAAQENIDKADEESEACYDNDPNCCYQCGELLTADDGPHNCVSLRASPVPS